MIQSNSSHSLAFLIVYFFLAFEILYSAHYYSQWSSGKVLFLQIFQIQLLEKQESARSLIESCSKCRVRFSQNPLNQRRFLRIELPFRLKRFWQNNLANHGSYLHLLNPISFVLQARRCYLSQFFTFYSNARRSFISISSFDPCIWYWYHQYWMVFEGNPELNRSIFQNTLDYLYLICQVLRRFSMPQPPVFLIFDL